MFTTKSPLIMTMAWAGFALATATTPAAADVIFLGSGTVAGNSVSGTVTFSITGGNTLKITLQNTSPANANESPGSTLTGLEFLLNNGDSIALTPASAVSPNAILNSAACNSNPCGGTNVNVAGEWGKDTTAAFSEYALGSSGYITTGLAGDIGNFNNGAAGTDLQSPASLGGIEFGLLSFTHGSLNGGLASSALIEDTVILTLTGDLSNVSETGISQVKFLYGTDFSDLVTIQGRCTASHICADLVVPEPASLALVGAALSGLALTRKRRRA